MELRAADLGAALARGLAPVYLVTGDETLLVQEACDAIIAAARAAGFSERLVMHADGADFDWNQIVQETASLSLFADRRILDVRVAGAAFGRDGAAVLADCAGTAAADTLLLVRCPRIEGQKRNSAWFRTLAGAVVVVTVWPLAAADLPRWLEGRLRTAGVRLAPEALQVLAERVEGNLLAAAQEIEKIKLYQLREPISRDDLLATLGDASHYDTFELIDGVLAGDAARVTRMLANLRQENVSVFAILGALTAQLRRIAGNERIPPQRARLAAQFLRRIGARTGTSSALATLALIDAQGKGEIPGDPWRSLEALLLRLCGVGVVDRGEGLGLLHPRAG